MQFSDVFKEVGLELIFRPDFFLPKMRRHVGRQFGCWDRVAPPALLWASTEAGIERRLTATKWYSCHSAAESPLARRRMSSQASSTQTIMRADVRWDWQSIEVADS
jgi:hypothetical protein